MLSESNQMNIHIKDEMCGVGEVNENTCRDGQTTTLGIVVNAYLHIEY